MRGSCVIFSTSPELGHAVFVSRTPVPLPGLDLGMQSGIVWWMGSWMTEWKDKRCLLYSFKSFFFFTQLRGFSLWKVYFLQNKPEVDQKAFYFFWFLLFPQSEKKLLCYLKYLHQIVQCRLLAQVLIIVANLVTCVWRRTMPQKFLKAKQQSEAFVVMRCKLPAS